MVVLCCALKPCCGEFSILLVFRYDINLECIHFSNILEKLDKRI